MSYILEALRKADAQRARDPARGIHAQPVASVSAGASDARRIGKWAWGALAGLIVIAAAWFWLAPDSAAPPPAPVASVARVEPAPAPASVPPAPATEVLPAPPAVVVAPPVAVMVATLKPRVAASAPLAATATATPAAGPLVPVADRTYTLADLPADVQQALPKLSVSGGVYSENVAQRMLIVNGQVFNEGSEVAPGVVLEQIRAKVAVLKFRGLRIAQPY